MAGVLLVLCLPLLGILYIIVKLDSPGPFLFLQLRAGKGKKPFWIYKIRTMVAEAENLKQKIKNLNEADGPVFKIRNDPRYTRIGKYLSRMAIDELPQMMNIVEGKMAFVGPRPLPLAEAAKIPKKYEKRFILAPGMTSTWVIEGAHTISFKKWMELDCQYVTEKSVGKDISIMARTILMLGRIVLRR